jgi:mRNA interferase MazF
LAGLTPAVSRGDVVLVAAGSGFGGKPRPALVIQADTYSGLSTIVLALFTTTLTGATLRPHLRPTTSNGLMQPSDLMVDILVTVRRDRIGDVLGRLSPADMTQVERALLVFLGFA